MYPREIRSVFFCFCFFFGPRSQPLFLSLVPFPSPPEKKNRKMMALRSTLSLALACLVLALAAASSASAQISPAMLVNAAAAAAKGAAGAAEQVTGEPVPRSPEQALAASRAHPADSVVVSDASASLARPVVSFLKQLPFLPTEDRLVRTPNGQEVMGEDGKPMTQAALASRFLDTATSVAPKLAESAQRAATSANGNDDRYNAALVKAAAMKDAAMSGQMSMVGSKPAASAGAGAGQPPVAAATAPVGAHPAAAAAGASSSSASSLSALASATTAPAAAKGKASRKALRM